MSGSEEDKALVKLIKDALVDTGLKAAESLPLIGPIVGIIKGMVDNSKSLYDSTNRQKLYSFYMGIYELDDDEKKYITNDNLAFIIRKLLQDDEVKKSNFYSRLTINIARSEYSERERIDFISVLSKLSCSDIDMAIRVFVHEKFELNGYGNINDQLISLSNTKNGIELKSLYTLMINGLIYDPTRGKAQTPYYASTDLMEQLLPLIIDGNKLNPEHLGMNRKNSLDILMALKNIDIKHKLIIKDIENGLTENCRLEIIAINDSDYWHLSNNAKYFLALRKVLSGQELYEIALFDNIDYVKSWYDGDDIIKKAISSNKVSSSYYISNCHNSNTENDKNSLLEYLDSIKHECNNNN